LPTGEHQGPTLTRGHTADHAVLLGYGIPKGLSQAPPLYETSGADCQRLRLPGVQLSIDRRVYGTEEHLRVPVIAGDTHRSLQSACCCRRSIKIDAVWLDGARSDSVHDRLERSLRLYREHPIRLPASGKSEDSGEYHTTTAAGGDAAANRAQSSDRQRAIIPLGGEA
jgi:hypothetical protein